MRLEADRRSGEDSYSPSEIIPPYQHLTRMIGRALIFLSMAATLSQARAGDVVFESKATRTHLLELFTSEGCSSCPPAEAWISKLKNESRLWSDFVPVAFHVDYWDHLGWRDPFASRLWTARQTEYSSQWKNNSVYTPGFVLDGQEWKDRNVPSASADAVGVLKITFTTADRLTATFEPATGAPRVYEIHLARLGFALSTDVKAGENRGRKLQHDFVVLSLANETMSGGSRELRLPAVTSKRSGESRGAVAAWVTEAGRIEPIQVVGGWLPEENL